MSTKPETLLVQKVMVRLKSEGGLWFKVHGGPFQMAGISDILGCYKGRFIAIELKVNEHVATELQQKFIKAVKSNRGYAGVAYSVEDAIKIRDNVKEM